jgi:hypothetical protein
MEKIGLTIYIRVVEPEDRYIRPGTSLAGMRSSAIELCAIESMACGPKCNGAHMAVAQR